MFFVVTTGRSGSHTISRALSQSPNCFCVHEPEPALNRESAMYQYGQTTAETLRAILLSTRPRMVRDKIYGESNQKLSLIIPVLAKTFPQAQFVWLIRDGRAVVASSYYTMEWYKSLHEMDRRRTNPLVPPWFWFRLRADLMNEMSTDEWDALTRFEKNCWLWARTNQIIEQQLAALPKESWMQVRLETLYDQVAEIWKFVGAQPPATVVNERTNASRQRPPSWAEWPADQTAAFEKWCGATMDRLYPDWRTKR